MIKLLIVDDIEKNLYMMQALLQGHGYEVVTAEDGAKALETARHDPPDMIISDILMPVMDGFSLCREWKKDEELKHIPFVFYTATYTDPKDEEFALSLGAERFLVKPLKPNVLVEMLQEIIDEHQAGQLSAPQEPVEEETIFLREYNEALIRKLEDKLLLLEEANQTLRFEIEERKQAEEALETSERKFRGIANNIPGMVFQLLFRSDGSTYFSYANPLAGELFGFPDDLESKDWDFGAHTHPDDREEFLTSINQAVENFTNWNYEGRTLLPDGEVKWFEGIASPTRVDDVVVFDGVLLDITRRKIAEETLRESEERFRVLINTAQDAILVNRVDKLGVPGTFIDVNEIACKMFGYTHEEFLAMTPLDLPRASEDKKIPESLKQLARDGKIRIEMDGKTKDGGRLPLEISIHNFNYLGEKYGLSIARDISERKQAEEEQKALLQEKGERVKELLCMYSVTESIKTRTREEVFQDVVELIPPGWQYPEITRAKIIFDKKVYVSEPFTETKWKQSVDLNVQGESRGIIEVYYLDERPELDEGPFLSEERNLINGITRNISEGIELQLAEEELYKHQEHLEELVEERTKELQKEIEERKQVEQKLWERTEELEVFNKAMVDREMKIIELKEEINGLCETLGKEPEYPPVWRSQDESS